MVQYPRNYQWGKWTIEKEQSTNHAQVSQTCISKTNLIFFYGRCKVMHLALFLQVRQGTVVSFQSPNLTDKSWDVHLYCALMTCGDGVSAGEKRYIKHQQFISYLSKIIKRGILFEKEKRRNNNPFQRSRIFDLCCFCW